MNSLTKIKYLSEWLNLANNMYNLSENEDFVYLLENMSDKKYFIETISVNTIRKFLDPFAHNYIKNKYSHKIFNNNKLSHEKKLKLYIARFTLNMFNYINSLLVKYNLVFNIDIPKMCKTYTNVLYDLLKNKKISNGEELYLELTEVCGNNLSAVIKPLIDHYAHKKIAPYYANKVIEHCITYLVELCDYETTVEPESESESSDDSDSSNKRKREDTLNNVSNKKHKTDNDSKDDKKDDNKDDNNK